LRSSIVIAVLVVALAASLRASAQTANPPVKQANQKSAGPASGSPTKSTSAKKVPAAPVKPAPPAITRIFETQLSGFTSQDAQYLYTRISLQDTRKTQTWYVRGALNLTQTRSGKSHSDVSTSKIDARLEHLTSPDTYSVVTGVLSSRNRDSAGTKNDRESGYQFLSFGYGRMLGPKAKADIGMGALQVFDDGDNVEPALMCAIRGRRPLSKVLSWDSDVLVLQSMGSLSDTKIDAEVGLTHDLSPGLSLRMAWTLNNLVRSINSNREWDSGVRASISYRHTTTK
jgi:hypothetical protein